MFISNIKAYVLDGNAIWLALRTINEYESRTEKNPHKGVC